MNSAINKDGAAQINTTIRADRSGESAVATVKGIILAEHVEILDIITAA